MSGGRAGGGKQKGLGRAGVEGGRAFLLKAATGVLGSCSGKSSRLLTLVRKEDVLDAGESGKESIQSPSATESERPSYLACGKG